MNKQTLQFLRIDQLTDLLNHSEDIIPRTESLDDSLTKSEITIITGVRRSGKSTLIKSLIKTLPNREEIVYLNFEDPRLLYFQSGDFEILYGSWLESSSENSPKIAIFDEIQNVEGWERWMNFFAEQKKFKVIITGSNSKLLSSELATHLTGRHKDIVLYPLSFREIALSSFPEIERKAEDETAVFNRKELATLKKLFDRYFQLGGFPRVWQSGDASLLGEYYNDILSRDIVRRYKLRQPQLIARFGACIMSDLGRKINKSKLAQTIGIKEANTVNKYLGYFDECFLGKEVRKFDLSVRKQLRNLSKFYSIDPVLARRIGFGHESKEGFYFENLVLIELLRRGAQTYYWQQEDLGEIDL
jgi:uncharacterized protein